MRIDNSPKEIITNSFCILREGASAILVGIREVKEHDTGTNTIKGLGDIEIVNYV
jgi:hypothetical protein